MEGMNNRLLFVCPDINKPSGGIKQIYRQVNILSDSGYNAFILHENRGFRCTWFNNKTPVVYNITVFKELRELKFENKRTPKQRLKSSLKTVLKSIRNTKSVGNEIKISANDILVFPEIYGPKLAQVRPGIKKVIYNQGAYQTFFGYDLNLKNKHTPYLHDDVISVIVNSEDAKEYMNLAFPKLNVHRVKYGFDSKNFSIDPSKKRQICFMPRRLRSDIVQVINILKFKGVLDNWDIQPIENMNEQQVANCMKESAFFLSFNINEGFGMPPAEAMACGCIVVGYPGHGGKEIFNSEFSYPVKDRDVQDYVKALEVVLKLYEDNNESFIKKSKQASEFILSNYSMDKEKQSILEAWSAILNH
ncbi:hypothetical protein FBALC1_05743 [Flavobacteriales bacterium ALC-1]|nr:hypothetical protein FBALC1_05743 [Flavobacteriales bacterium ALC-1]